jgi:outer membrane protein assembly factor BamB
MRSLLVVFAFASALVVPAGCSSSTSLPPDTLDPCAGRSQLLSLDASTGDLDWRARLSQTSELPLTVGDGKVLVSGPCGAAVVRLDSGGVIYDDSVHGVAVGLAGNRLFARGTSLTDGTLPIFGFDLGNGDEVSSYATNQQFQDAAVAQGSLLTLYGDELSASSESGTGPDWRIQIPVYRTPRLVVADDLVLVTGGDGSTFAVNFSDGTLRWRTVPPVPSTAYSLDITPTRGSVLTAATTYDDRHLVYATDTDNGRLRWSRTSLGVVAADRDLTLLRTSTAFEAVGTVDGRLRWSHPAPRIRYVSDVLPGGLTGDTAVLRPRYDAMVGLDRASGRLRWRGPTPSLEILSVGRIVVTTTTIGQSRMTVRSGVVAVDARHGVRLWRRTVERGAVALAGTRGGTVLLLDGDRVPHSTD